MTFLALNGKVFHLQYSLKAMCHVEMPSMSAHRGSVPFSVYRSYDTAGAI